MNSARRVSYLFALFGAVLIPFPYYLLPFHAQWVQAIAAPWLRGVLIPLFGVAVSNPSLSSDAVSLYLWLLSLLLLAILVVGFASLRTQWAAILDKSIGIIRTGLYYFLALMLVKYGFDKLFKGQFYLPEPNTLFTPLGQLDKDILYWSTMGSSYGYNLFLGACELIAGAMLLWRKTRVAGLLMSAILLFNIAAVNFCFDISVKLYACFLLTVALLLLGPNLLRLYAFLIQAKNTSLTPEEHVIRKDYVRIPVKIFCIGMIVLEGVYPYLKAGCLNDDLAPRPFLHGAYEVKSISVGEDSLIAVPLTLKRVFVHRNGYMIFQDMQDRFKDYHMDIDTAAETMLLTGYRNEHIQIDYSYQPSDSTLTLEYDAEGQRYHVDTKAIDWRKLPLLQPQFHWTVDEVK